MTEKEKRTKKYMVDQRHKKRLEHRAKNWRGYPAVAIWVDEKYIGNDQREEVAKPYAKKLYLSSNCQRYRYFKNYSNRKVRRSAQSTRKGNSYRKTFDYKLEID